MRIRLELVAPLPAIRCWFEIPTHGSRGQEIISIAQLEQYIKQELNIHVNQALHLELEGFQLLPNGRVNGLLRDNDILRISLDESNTATTISSSLLTPKSTEIVKNKPRKRKEPSDIESSSSSSDESEPKVKHKRVKVFTVKKSSSSESVSTTTTSSESDNETSGDDNSSDSSSRDSAPSELSIAKTEPQSKNKTAFTIIPPGKGSRATKSRNLRRKLAKQRRQLNMESIDNATQEQSANHNIGEELTNTNHSPASVEQTVVQPIKQNALPVKNKPKHFAKAMQGAVRTHMRFDASEANQLTTTNENKQTTKETITSPSRLVVTAVEFHGNKSNQDWWTYRTEPVLENNFTTSTNLNVSDKSPEKTLINTAAPLNSNDIKRDYEAAPALTTLPEPGQLLAFKQLEMSEAYTPEISDYKEGTVLAYDAVSDKVTLQLATHSMPMLWGTSNNNNMDDEYNEEDKPRRRFEIDLGDDSEYIIESQISDSIITIDRNTMLETKCLHA